MIKHYCDICGRLLNPAIYVNDKDPDDYTYGEIEVDLGVWFKIDDICLICYEKPEDFCHRHLVADWLNKNGFKCKEWTGE